MERLKKTGTIEVKMEKIGRIERIERIEQFYLKQHVLDLDTGSGVTIENCLIMYDNKEKGLEDIERLKKEGVIFEPKKGILKAL